MDDTAVQLAKEGVSRSPLTKGSPHCCQMLGRGIGEYLALTEWDNTRLTLIGCTHAEAKRSHCLEVIAD